jgi:hypothetical protein
VVPSSIEVVSISVLFPFEAMRLDAHDCGGAVVMALRRALYGPDQPASKAKTVEQKREPNGRSDNRLLLASNAAVSRHAPLAAERFLVLTLVARAVGVSIRAFQHSVG